MLTGDRAKPISQMEEYISGALQKVESTTGCKFGEGFTDSLLRSKDTILDSEPPSRAVITFRTFNSAKSLEYTAALQRAHFFDGRDYNDHKLYGELSEQFGIDSKSFMSRFKEDEMIQHVQEEFHWVKESGVQGYPTVVVRSNSKYYMLSNGYVSVKSMEESLKSASKYLD